MKSNKKIYYPVSLSLVNRLVLVVGAGTIGTRKIRSLLTAGAKVRVVAPRASRQVESWARTGRIRWAKRNFRKSDVRRVWAVIGSTSDQEINKSIYDVAGRERVFVNIADKPELCTFIMPSVLRRGDLTIAISTSGASPSLARYIRLGLEKTFGSYYAEFLIFMRELRTKASSELSNAKDRKLYFNKIIEGPYLSLIHSNKRKEAKKRALALLRKMTR